MKKNMRYQRGQAIILIVFGIVGLIGMTALAIDGGNAYSDRRNAQNAADTAAFAAALNKLGPNATAATIVQAGRDRAASNGYDNDLTTNTVAVNNPPASGSQYDCAHTPATCNEYVQVIITSNVKTFFAPIVGIPQVTNTVQAVAHAKPGNPTLPLYGGNAIVGLAPSGCDVVNFCGSSELQIWGGGVFSNSSDNRGLDFNGGHNNKVTLYDGPFQMVAPTYSENSDDCGDSEHSKHDGEEKSDIVAPYGFQGNQTPYPYPPTDLPNPTCSTNGTVSGSTLNPGNYGSISSPQTFPPNGVDTLNPGTYCVYGDFNVNGSSTLTGNGVTIVMETGAIHWNGSSQIELSGPTSGNLSGLTVFAPLSNTSVMVINGRANVNLTGTFYTPGAALSFNGKAQIQKHNLQFIAKTVQLCGNLDTQLEYGSTDTAKQSSSPTIELTK